MENLKRRHKRSSQKRARIASSLGTPYASTLSARKGSAASISKAKRIEAIRARKTMQSFDVDGLIRAIQADTERLGSMPKPQARVICSDRLMRAGIIDDTGRLTPHYTDKKKKKA